MVTLCFSLDISHLCILHFSLCPWIILSISLSLNIFSQFSLAALMLVCITVQHWLELSALTEQHLPCWSVQYLYNSPLYWHEASWNKDGAKHNRVQNIEKQDKNKIWKREQVRNRRGKWKEQVRERLQRRGWGKERRGGKDKIGKGKTEREKVEEQETRPKMLGKAFLFWDKCTMFGAQHYTEQCPACYSAAICFSFFLT